MVDQESRDELKGRITIKCAAKDCERTINLSKTFLDILCEYEQSDKFTISGLKFFCRECSEKCLEEYKEVNKLMDDEVVGIKDNWQNNTSISCIFELIAKRDAAMGGAAFARQPCCLSFLQD